MARNVAVITGASSGIGLALTKHLLAKRWRVVQADINQSDLQIEHGAGDLLFVKTDVSSWDEQANLFKTAQEWAGQDKLAFLAANAGVADTAGSLDMLVGKVSPGESLQKPDTTPLSVNLVGVMYSAQLFVHYAQLKGNEARIVVTSSGAGLYPMPSHPVYCASKHGVIGYTRSIAPNLPPGITINCICPGFVISNITAPLVGVIPEKYVTPMDSMMAAYDEFLSNEQNYTGRVMEVSVSHRHWREPVLFLDEEQRWLSEDSGAFFSRLLDWHEFTKYDVDITLATR